MKAELMNRMQEILEEAVAAKELAGGSLLVRQHGEELCYLQAGMADREKGEAVRRDHIYRLYSMSKPVTAAAAMVLFERGQLDLAEPVSRYLPEFSGQLQAFLERKDEPGLIPSTSLPLYITRPKSWST